MSTRRPSTQAGAATVPARPSPSLATALPALPLGRSSSGAGALPARPLGRTLPTARALTPGRTTARQRRARATASTMPVFLAALGMFAILFAVVIITVKITGRRETVQGRPENRVHDPSLKKIMAIQAAIKAANPEYEEEDGDFTVENGRIIKARITKARLSELSPFMGVPLVSLDCSGNKITDVSPLTGMPLELLVCVNNQIKDLSPLKGMGIRRLAISFNPIGDLAPLNGMPLARLACTKTNITGLDPLRGMQLERLDCSSTGVRDLTPLNGMPLQLLSIHNTEVVDLTPLAGMDLKTFSFTPGKIRRGLDVVRNMSSIKEIGNSGSDMVTPKEFWADYDRGQQAKNAPAKK